MPQLPKVPVSPVLCSFNTPGYVVDFPDDPAQQAKMDSLWSGNVSGWLIAAQTGDIWDLVNYGPRPAFYNPLITPTPATAQLAPIQWNAFPGRLSALFPNDAPNWNGWADTGPTQEMTTNLCTGPVSATPYTPTGPRGWQDEYCEWSVQRDGAGELQSVMFTCENPEYWLTLWDVDPQAVLKLYGELVSPAVTLDDLCLHDDAGLVRDAAKGNALVYNPLNIWNNGTSTLPGSGGAVHLTSSPNTLGAEFDLAAAASMPRVDGSGQSITAPQPLVCCAKFGRAGRHSDPTIGADVNATVNNGAGQRMMATLTNPPGLYMQTPDWTQFGSEVIPNPQQFAASCWKVVRGRLADPKVPNDIDRILHATFTVPAGTKATDLLVDGVALQFGSQIASTITMMLLATAFGVPGPAQTAVGCTADNPNPSPNAGAVQSLNVFKAYRALEAKMNEIPLSVPILAMRLPSASVTDNLAIPLNVNTPLSNPQVTVTGGGVTITVTGQDTVSNVPVLIVTISVAPEAQPGPRGVIVTDPQLPKVAQAAFGLLTIVSGTPVRAPSGKAWRLRAGRG